MYCYLTTQQQTSTIKNPKIAPAVPTTHVKRINKITPKIFCIHGKKTPINVPIHKEEIKKLNLHDN